MDSLSDYDYELPEHLIAQAPLTNRRDSKLLVLGKHVDKPEHRNFCDIMDYLNPGDALVINTSKVMKARLIGRKNTGGKVEILLSRPLSDNTWLCLVCAKGNKEHLRIEFGCGNATILKPAPEDPGAFIVSFEGELGQIIEECGALPLPPYITRQPTEHDAARYQTVYADDKTMLSVAAPTAGLHFDLTLLDAIKEKGVSIIPVTLHVGPGTFLPVRHDDLSLHQMHGELAEISQIAANQINDIKRLGGRVIAVGTTAVRTLESAAVDQGTVKAGSYLTRLFIRPGFRFKIIDALITNFHLPKTTLIMLVSAIAGRERILAAYNEAIHQQYRFFSYGDASYIELKDYQ